MDERRTREVVREELRSTQPLAEQDRHVIWESALTLAVNAAALDPFNFGEVVVQVRDAYLELRDFTPTTGPDRPAERRHE